MINDLKDNVSFEEKDLNEQTKDMSLGTVSEYENDNLYCSGNLFLRCSVNSSSNSEDSFPYLELSSVIFLYISVILKNF